MGRSYDFPQLGAANLREMICLAEQDWYFSNTSLAEQDWSEIPYGVWWLKAAIVGLIDWM